MAHCWYRAELYTTARGITLSLRKLSPPSLVSTRRWLRLNSATPICQFLVVRLLEAVAPLSVALLLIWLPRLLVAKSCAWLPICLKPHLLIWNFAPDMSRCEAFLI